MTTFILTLGIFLAVGAAMAVGAIVKGQRLRGSCGATGKDCACSPLAARNCRLREQGADSGA